MIKPFPLSWPPTKNRTSANRRQKAKFKVTFAQARDELLKELSRFKATNIVISSNVPLRQDGLPLATFSEPSDPGVVITFKAFKKDYIFSCDCWIKVKDNLRAIGKHIEALRAIERWGVGSIEEIFEPFLLPTSSVTYQSNQETSWWVVLEVSSDATIEEIKSAYRTLSRKYHPDTGGDPLADLAEPARLHWDQLQWAYQQALIKSH